MIYSYTARWLNMRRSLALGRNHWFVVGLLVGLLLSVCIPEDLWDLVQQEECDRHVAGSTLIEKLGPDFEPRLSKASAALELANKPALKAVVRPRYYSSELGIREKLFVGVLTTSSSINTLAMAFNRTTAHLVDEIKFFITTGDKQPRYALKNIVGFERTDARQNLQPFHVFKHIAENYLSDYDYFLITPDTAYVDARKLQELVSHLSVRFDVYMGTPREAHAGTTQIENERDFCELEAGILLSNSVLRKLHNNLDWCVRNYVAVDHSTNIGRCVKYASKAQVCQRSFQGVEQSSFKLAVPGRTDFSILAAQPEFLNATFVYPIQVPQDHYRLHAYFSKYHLGLVQRLGYELEEKAHHISNGSIAKGMLEIRWPLGVPPANMPETRHDILVWQLINRTHLYLPSAERVTSPLKHIDTMDFDQVHRTTLEYAKSRYPQLSNPRLQTAYRRFDPTRGMDYHLHFGFDSDQHHAPIVKSFEVVKPLGRLEIVPTPYVTESTRISIVVPTFEHQANEARDFIAAYERTCMQNQDNTFLLLILLYGTESESKGEADPFKRVKTMALDLSSKYRADGSRIAWISIRLPRGCSSTPEPPELMINSVYGRNERLSIALVDLAMPKIGLEALVLIATTGSSIRSEFLNRVRMNTIENFQIYSPIGFQKYPCHWLHFCQKCEGCDVSQGSGYFDQHNYDVVSFYSRDYVQARKLLNERGVPIIRTDADIPKLFETRTDNTSAVQNILDVFVASQLTLHALRGVEPNLHFGGGIGTHLKRQAEEELQTPPRCPLPDQRSAVHSRCVHLASRKQIGGALIRYEDQSLLAIK